MGCKVKLRRESDAFSNLGHVKNEVRFKSSIQVLSLVRKQKTVNTLVLSVIRLLQGMAGPKRRAGCFSTLKWIFDTLPEHIINFETYDDMIQDIFNPAPSATKKEIGDLCMGELLAYTIIIHSNYLEEESHEVRELIASRIMNLSHTKSYLHHPAFINLGILYSKFKLDFISDDFKSQLERLDRNGLDKLYFLLSLDSSVESKLMKIIFDTEVTSLYHKKWIEPMVNLVLEQPESWKDHPCYELLVKKLALHPSKLSKFWKLISEKVFNNKSEQKKKIIALNIMSLILNYMTDKDFVVDHIMNDKVIITLKESGKKCKKLISPLATLLKNAESSTNLRLITNVLFDANCVNFDEATGYPLIMQLVASLNLDDIKLLSVKFYDILKGKLSKTDQQEVYTSKEKTIIFSYYSKLIMHLSARNEVEWRCQQLTFLIDIGLFADSNVVVQLAELIRNYFFHAVSNVHPNIEMHQKILLSLLEHILLKLRMNHQLRIKVTFDDLKEWKATAKWILMMWESKEEKTGLLTTKLGIPIMDFALYITINMFRDSKESLIILQDIKKLAEEDNIHNLSEVIVQLFLKLLRKTCSNHRSLINGLFKEILRFEFDFTALYQLINILDPDLQNTDDDSLAESNNESEEDDDVEGNNSDSEDNKNHSEVDEEKLTKRLEVEKESSDSGNDLIDVDEMNDDDIKRLNLMAENLKRNFGKKKKKIATQNQFTHFRIRVLDLIEICCKECSCLTFEFWLTIIPILIRLFKFSSEEESEIPLHFKIGNCLKKISSISFHKIYDILEEHSTPMISLIKTFLDEVINGTNRDDKNVLLNVCKKMVLVSNVYFKRNEIQITNQFTTLLTSYLECLFHSRNIIPVHFYIGLCQMNWDGMSTIINVVAKYTFCTNIRLNRRLLGLKIIESYFSNNYYFQDISVSEIKLFQVNFCNMKKNSDLYNKPDDVEKFISKVRCLLNLLLIKGRDKYFKWNRLEKAVDDLVTKSKTNLNGNNDSVSDEPMICEP